MFVIHLKLAGHASTDRYRQFLALNLMSTKISFANFRVGQKFVSRAGKPDFSIDHYIATVGQFESMIGVLFDQEDCSPLAA